MKLLNESKERELRLLHPFIEKIRLIFFDEMEKE